VSRSRVSHRLVRCVTAVLRAEIFLLRTFPIQSQNFAFVTDGLRLKHINFAYGPCNIGYRVEIEPKVILICDGRLFSHRAELTAEIFVKLDTSKSSESHVDIIYTASS